jgi:hypothetical protein
MSRISSKQRLLVWGISLAAGGLFAYYLFNKTFGVKKGPYDVVDKENAKIGVLFEQLRKAEMDRYASNWYPGIMPTATQQADTYLKTLRAIESYASHGTKSNYKFNYLEVKLEFTDGRTVKKRYTGQRVVQAFGVGAQLLVRLELENGVVVRAFTNGVERGGSPDDIKPALSQLLNAALTYDMRQYPQYYYYPRKTQKDVEKEWEEVK